MAEFDVYVNERLVATLAPGGGGAWVLAYRTGVAAEDFVSLTMPVRLESYRWTRGLPPIFLQNLPEGYQKDVIRVRLGPHADVSDPGLLALTGHHGVGRVRVVPTGQALAQVGGAVALAKILATPDSRERLLEILQHGLVEGISGVMPKSFATGATKATAVTEGWILKTALANLPGLAANEYLCLEVARRAGLAVPRAELSEDGQVLAVERFDRLPDGTALGVEDFCALKGLDPIEKYKGSLEDLAKIVQLYVPAGARASASLQLFQLLALNYALRNGDAHLKNFALTYSSFADVALAPVFDVVTVTAYPDYASDTPALTLNGRKVWRVGKTLAQFAHARLSLTSALVRASIEAITNAVHEVTPRVSELAERIPEFREPAKRLLASWDAGLSDIAMDASGPRRTQTAPNALREQAGLSGPKPAKRFKRTTSRDPDGPFGHKSR
jgi:serine/threonine-protein kinase HipA